MRKILADMKELLMEPYYVPLMIVFVFLGYQAWDGPFSFIYTPFLILGVIIYIPFAITLCSVNSLMSDYFGMHYAMSSIIYCSDLTGPKLPLLLLILAIEYSILYLVVRAIVRSLRHVE